MGLTARQALLAAFVALGWAAPARALEAPRLRYPAEGAAALQPQVGFTWWEAARPDGAVTYTLEVDDDPGFASPELRHAGLEATSYLSTPQEALARDRRWYWRVTATDAAESAASLGRGFRVPTPRSRYVLRVGAAGQGFDDPVHYRSVVLTATSHALPDGHPLVEGQAYDWRVTALDQAGNERQSAPFRLSLGHTLPPPVPELVWPEASASIANLDPTFAWTAVEDPTGPVTYTLQLGAAPEFAPPLVSRGGILDRRATAGAALPQGRRLYWRVLATDPQGHASVSETRFCIITPKRAHYEWEIIGPGGDFDAPLSRAGPIDATEFTLPEAEALVEGTSYFWRVVATDPAGNSRASAAAFRMDLGDTFAPPLPAPVFPAENETVLNPATTFFWTSVPDPNGVSYRIQVDDDAGFHSPEVDSAGLALNHFTAPAGRLTPGQRYHWRVGVTDNEGNQRTGTTSRFLLARKQPTYELRIAQDALLAGVVRQAWGLRENRHTLGDEEALDGVGDHWWQVVATDPAGNTRASASVFHFSLEDLFPPEPPALLSPAPAERMLNPAVTFLWSPAVDPSGVTYRLQVDDGLAFSSPEIDEAGIEANHFGAAAGALAADTRYWWRIESTDGQGNRSVTPAQRFDVVAKQAVYGLQVARDAGFGQVVVDHQRIAGTEHTLVAGVEELDDVGDFWWRVVASDPAGNERASTSVWQLSLEDEFPPPTPALLYPAANERVLNPRVTFVWSASIDPSGVTYSLEVDDDRGFHTPEIDAEGLADRHFTPPVGTLRDGTRYWWRVGARDGQGNGDTSEPQAFTVVSADPTYQLQVSREADFEPLDLSQADIEGTEYELLEGSQELEETGTYHWRVIAEDPAGNVRTSDSAFVLQLADEFPPGRPEPLHPPYAGRVLNPEVTFIWTGVTDPSGVSYELQVDDDPNFESLDLMAEDLEEPHAAAPMGALASGRVYWWRVIASDGRGNAITSEPSTFTLDAHRPTYTLTVSREQGLEPAVVSARGIPEAAYELGEHEALEETGRYYWTVEAVDPAGNARSAGSVFELQLEDRFPPPAPELVSPRNHETVLNPQPTLVWSPVYDPSGVEYRVQVDDDPAFGSPEADAGGLEAAWYSLSRAPLTFGVRYHWRVQALDGIGHAVWSAPWSFLVYDRRPVYRLAVARDPANFDATTFVSAEQLRETEYALAEHQALDDTGRFWWRVRATDPAGNGTDSASTFMLELEDIYPPRPPDLLYPPDRETVLNRALTFVWSAVSDPTPPVTYELQVDDESSFASPHAVVAGLQQSHYRLVVGELLEPGKTYYWRVRAADGNGQTSTSVPFRLVVRNKDVSYTLSVSRFQGFDPVIWSSARLGEPTYETPPDRALAEGGTYYWRVVAQDLAGWETLGNPAASAFRLEDIYPPVGSQSLYPPVGHVVANPRVTFAWSDSLDPSGVTYLLQVDDADDFADPLQEMALLEDAHARAADLPPEKPLWWRVRATDGAGNTVWSGPWPFSVARLDPVYRLEIVPDDDFGLAACEECVNGAVEVCGNDEGLCSSGVRECVLGKWTPCAGAVPPVPEGCDGKDNDCDGEVDEGGVCGAGCGEGALRPCGADVGACQAGVQRCSGGSWRECTGSVPGDTERCDAADNDCDGFTDESGVCDGCQVSARARRIVPIEEAEYALAGDEALEEDIEYKWRVVAIDKAGGERPADQVFRFATTEGGLVIPGGVRATYYDGIDFDEEKLWRVERVIDQPASSDGNPFSDFDTGIGADTFSVAWEGWVHADFDETYTFYATSDDGQRLRIDGQLLVDDWVIHETTTRQADMALTEGWHFLKYEMFDNLGTARATLEYSSPSTPRQVIPSDHLGVAGDPDDAVPPSLDDLYVGAVTPDAAVLVYSSDEPVRAVVEYGPTPAYGGRTMGRVSETVRFSGLQPGATYHYRVTLLDGAGNETASEDLTLCTPGLADVVGGRLEADYFSGIALGTKVVSRRETGIDQPLLSDGNSLGDFGTGAGPDGFSARWTGIVRVDRAGEYIWLATSDDGQRLWVDLERQLNDWRAHLETTRWVAQTLDASWHTLRYEWYDNDGPALARLEWQGETLARQVIPPSNLAYIRASFYLPRITARAEPVVAECAAAAGSPLALEAPAVTDCLDPAPVIASDAPASFPLGETRLVWQASNRFGLTAPWQEFVTVQDTAPPEVTPPAEVVTEATSPQGTPVDLPEPEAEDVCDAAPEITFHLCADRRGAPCTACWTDEDVDGGIGRVAGQRNEACECVDAPLRFALGTTSVTTIVEDAAGNCGSARFDATVADTTPPFIVPGDLEFVCRTAPIPAVTVRDNATPADQIELLCRVDTDAEPGGCDREMDLDLGAHWVDYIARDGAGNERIFRLDFEVSNEDPEPPVLELVAGPDGWTSGDAALAVRATDNCDPEPDVAFSPEPETLEVDGDVLTATWTAEGVYVVDVTAADDAGSEGTLSDITFGVDRTPPTAAFSGLAEVDQQDPLAWPAFFAGEVVYFSLSANDLAGEAVSGIASVTVVAEGLGAGATRTLHESVYGLDFEEPPAGPSRLKNLRCADVVPAGEETWCDANGDVAVAALPGGDYRLRVTVRDVAGNEGSLDRYFTVMDWHTAVVRTADLAERLLAGDPSALSALMLQQIVQLRDPTLLAVDTPELLGNALLYTYTLLNALAFCEDDGEDTGDTRAWLSAGALQTVAAYQRFVTDEVGDDDPDVEQADALVDEARDYADLESHLASLLALENAYFYQRHALEPFLILDDVDAADAAPRIMASMNEYLAHPGVNARDEVGAVAAIQRYILDHGMFTTVLNRRQLPPGMVNAVFLDLLKRLNQMASMMADAQDLWAWVRSWQWPVSLQIRELARIGLEAAALQLLDDPADPADPVLAEARATYDEGVGFIDDRLVDDALDVYIDARCLIFEVYNHAGFDPAAAPPLGWHCAGCVTTGDCPR